jgi:hypothetical protein
MMIKATKLEHPAAQRRLDRFDRQRGVPDWRHWPHTASQLDASEYSKSLPGTQGCPDTEDEQIIAWGLAQSEVAVGPRAKIDVLYGEGTNLSKPLQCQNLHS